MDSIIHIDFYSKKIIKKLNKINSKQYNQIFFTIKLN